MASTFLLPHERHGDGPHKVLAVHGWFADRSAWAPVVADLDRVSFEYALVDLRGYGEAKDTPGAYTTTEGAGDLLALADRLGWERFSLIGHSMGASVAQRVVASARARVRRIAGVSPVPASGLALPPQRWELFSTADNEPAHRRTIIDLTTGGVRPAAWLDRMTARSVARSDAKAFRAWLDSWTHDDFHADLEGCTTPALAVTGQLDPSLPAELIRATWLHYFTRGELVDLPVCGHYAMDEAPLALIRVVEDFLRADRAGRARRA
ncbi:alpha/beta fold hydrolase [Streptomyces sp. NPDC016845]|uniref:alpha/beta fold hydrolase n=1 Tax=Streptomyces sp. NPDC016845 TaxID=3364972 RepID=UPI00378A1F10